MANNIENKIHSILPKLRVVGDLFIREIKGSIIMSQLPLTNYPSD
jgi:hypothetical protein